MTELYPIADKATLPTETILLYQYDTLPPPGRSNGSRKMPKCSTNTVGNLWRVNGTEGNPPIFNGV